LLETIEQHFKKPKPKEDRHDVFDKNVALKMRDMSNNTQRLLAERIINDALFMAEMGQLAMSHSIRDSIHNASSMGFPTSQHFNNNYPHFPESQTRSYYETPSPVTMNSDNSNQSLASYVSHFSDA
jgi:patatin-like phospholipase/acyl hydrolase